MPHTINGIGTHYYGRNELEIEQGTCEFCGRTVSLETYETGEYFVILFVPVFPLGRKQIFNMCPACTKYRSMPLKEWHDARDQAIQDSARMLAMRMEDPQAGLDHLKTLTAFRQYNEAQELVSVLDQMHNDNVEVQLCLGAWLSRFGDPGHARQCLEKAWQLDPDHPGSIRARAESLIGSGSFDDARQLLNPLQFPSPEFDPAIFMALGDGFQSVSQHDRALEAYCQVLQASPHLMQDKNFRKTVRLSEKALGLSGESIIQRKRLYEHKAFWIAASVLLLVCGSMFLAHTRAQNRGVHVVNGLPHEITIQIDGGTELIVPATGWVKTSVAEGAHTIQVLAPPGLEQRQFTLETGFFEQMFATPVVVLDPTCSAIVYHEKTVYSEDPEEDDPGNEFDYHVGQTMYVFKGIDFPFAPFPDEIEVDSTIDKTYRDRIDFEPLEPEQFLNGQLEASPEEQLYITEQILTLCPDNRDFWISYAGLAMVHNQMERCVNFVEPLVTLDPVNVEVHRFYQSASEQLPGRRDELIALYDEYLQGDSDNADLIYLRGRLMPSIPESVIHMNAALEIDPTHVHAMQALAFDLNSLGDHSAAADCLGNAIQIDPENEDVHDLYRDVLLAARDFGRLEQLTHDVPQTWTQLTDTMNFLVKSKQFPRLSTLREDFVAESGEWGGVMFDIHDRYLQKKFDEIPELVDAIPFPRYQSLFNFYASLETGNLDEAKRHFEELELHYGDFELLLAIALHRQGDIKAAEEIREQFIVAGEQKGPRESAFAALLRDCESRVIEVEEIRELSVEPDRKRIYAIAIREFSTVCDPDLDEEIQRLNYDYCFPYHFINNCLASEISVVSAEPRAAEPTQEDAFEDSWQQEVRHQDVAAPAWGD